MGITISLRDLCGEIKVRVCVWGLRRGPLGGSLAVLISRPVMTLPLCHYSTLHYIHHHACPRGVFGKRHSLQHGNQMSHSHIWVWSESLFWSLHMYEYVWPTLSAELSSGETSRMLYAAAKLAVMCNASKKKKRSIFVQCNGLFISAGPMKAYCRLRNYWRLHYWKGWWKRIPNKAAH